MDIKQKVMEQFGKHAQGYVTSTSHSSREDLSILEEWAGAEQPERALDVATGGGHAANVLAPLVKQLTALDLTPEILQASEAFLKSKGHTEVQFVLGDAESLPFADESFELVTCRIAAHHFPNPDAFVQEVHRVLSPQGCFLLFDNVAPEPDELDVIYNKIEKDRDPSHFRAWKKTEWIRMAESAGFYTEQLLQAPKPFQFESWCERMSFAGEDKDALERYMLEQTPEVRRALDVQEEQGKLVSFQGSYCMMKLRKLW
ncbi:class I SAM-dependent methyltransferase [Paenibacillus cremeus]|uniref:Class I SAM-dependent methyltransferase n=1 Tax=Paenibacillus cremeus TaxID=2163881 RepID=A0A559KIM0_9BACL|nr:class I SAM-dependent methyltransferase [Paenibacillus cremeus]TVY11984.1 class I SAM-dependent methyltransferase [Paenibacillus cremeus]